jgi:pSer/pThr/pTyr-binding forkhead associated (FHA) protein
MEIVFDSEMKMYSVKDLGSQNGTFVNKVRLSEPKHESELQPLSHGDILTVSSTSLMLHIHCGSETCDECEPGEIQARLQNGKFIPMCGLLFLVNFLIVRTCTKTKTLKSSKTTVLPN